MLAIALEAVGAIGAWAFLALEIMYQADLYYVLGTFSCTLIATGSIVFAKLCKRDLWDTCDLQAEK